MFYDIFINMFNKICSSCKIEKPIECFHKYKNSKDGHTHRCKNCVSRKKFSFYQIFFIVNFGGVCPFGHEHINISNFLKSILNF
jgi:hypothetical protein